MRSYLGLVLFSEFAKGGKIWGNKRHVPSCFVFPHTYTFSLVSPRYPSAGVGCQADGMGLLQTKVSLHAVPGPEALASRKPLIRNEISQTPPQPHRIRNSKGEFQQRVFKSAIQVITMCVQA